MNKEETERLQELRDLAMWILEEEPSRQRGYQPVPRP